MPIAGWPTTIALGVLSLAFLDLFFSPLPTLAECTEVSGRVTEVYTDSTRVNRRSTDRLRFKIEGHERTYSYEESEPMYQEVKARLPIRSHAQVWFKEPSTFIFPLYSTELWRIDVDDRTIVDYDTIAANAGRTKNSIALIGLFFFGLATITVLRSTVQAVQA